MSTPTNLIEYDTNKWIDPLAVREIKILPPVEGKSFRVLVMRDGTHTAVEFEDQDEAEAYVAWVSGRVNEARQCLAPAGTPLFARDAKPK